MTELFHLLDDIKLNLHTKADQNFFGSVVRNGLGCVDSSQTKDFVRKAVKVYERTLPNTRVQFRRNCLC